MKIENSEKARQLLHQQSMLQEKLEKLAKVGDGKHGIYFYDLNSRNGIRNVYLDWSGEKLDVYLREAINEVIA